MMIGDLNRPAAWKILVFVVCMLVINLYALYVLQLSQRTQAWVLFAQSGLMLTSGTLRAFVCAKRVRVAAESGSSTAESLQGLNRALVGVALGIASLGAFLRLL